MIKKKSGSFAKATFAALSICVSSGNVLAAQHPAATPAEQTITYHELEQHLGEHVIVHTTFNTVRSGTVVKVSKTALTLKLQGDAELTIPVETIRSVALPQESAKPAVPGDTRAKKN